MALLEAYRVGVQIAISGDVGRIIGQLIKDFERLDSAVNGTKEKLGSLTNALKSMAAEGKSAADAWQNVAKSIGAAAKAAKEAAASSASMQPRQRSAGQTQAASEAQRVINEANAAGAASQRAAPPGTFIVPYTGGAYGQPRGRYPDQGSGPTIGLPYQSSEMGLLPYVQPRPNGGYPIGRPNEPETLYPDEIIPPYRPTPGPSGGPGVGAGPTINGTATRPGGNGPTYGPYGPGTGGNGPGGQFSPNVPAGPGGGGIPPGGGGVGFPQGAGGQGGGMPPLNYPPWMNHQYVPGRPLASASDFNGMAMLPDIAGFEWMKSNWEKSAAYLSEQAHLVQQGFTVEEAHKAGDTALQVQREVGPITPEAVLHIVDKLMNVTQDKSVATNKDLLTEYAKTAVVMASYGHGGELHELDAAIRAGEFRGVLTHEGKDGKQEIDVQGLSDFLKQLTSMASISGGDIGPSKVLATLRSSGAAGSIISKDELTRTMALIIASGTSRAGSNLQAFEQQFTAGRMSEAAANLLMQMHIINGTGGDARHNPYMKKMGIGQFLMLPGAMPPELQEQAAKEPSLFIMEHLLPKFQQEIRKNFGSRYDLSDDKGKLVYESKYAQMVASRIGGGVEMTEVIRNILLMQRDVAAAEKNMKLDNYKIQMEQNPLNAPKAMAASYQGLQIQLGSSTMQPVVDVINHLTEALNKLTSWTTEHGDATRIGMEALAGGLIALGAVGIIALAGTLGGLTGALTGLGAATVLATEGAKSLDAWLHKTFGWLIGTNESVDKTKKSMKEKGIELPWWAPIPVPGHGSREARPAWADWGKWLGMGRAQGSEPVAPAAGARPAAPIGDVRIGPFGTASDPQYVIVQNQLTSRDLVHGTSERQSNMMNRPPSGYTGTDTRLDPLGAFYGMVTSPN